VLRAAPGVVCLQEVFPELSKALRGCRTLNEIYNISPFDVGPYGCLILAQKELQAEFTEVNLTSCMGRFSCLFAQSQICQLNIGHGAPQVPEQRNNAKGPASRSGSGIARPTVYYALW